MKNLIYLFAIMLMLLSLPSSAGGSCCTQKNEYDQDGYSTGYFRIKNNTDEWVECWIERSNNQFSLAPHATSRRFYSSYWECD